jgi:hypothetical protein
MISASAFAARHLCFGLLLSSGCSFQVAAAAENLSRWHDGKAEVNGYVLRQPRYGQLRDGRVVLIFVTEPFSWSDRVKADPGRHPEQDVFPVMKLNYVKDFQTGIYDYNLMTSVFVALGRIRDLRPGMPAKLMFSSQEWCGTMYEELLFDKTTIRQRLLSYFDGESKPNGSLPNKGNGMSLDQILVNVRDLQGEWIAPGTEKTVPMLPSLERSRFLHRPLAWTTAKLSRDKIATTLDVPAGRFQVSWSRIQMATGDEYAYAVEEQSPFRIIAWRGPEGEEGRLLGSERLPYWQLNGPDGTKYLRNIGLAAPAFDAGPKGPSR